MYAPAAHDAALIVFMAAFGERVLELINFHEGSGQS